MDGQQVGLTNTAFTYTLTPIPEWHPCAGAKAPPRRAPRLERPVRTGNGAIEHVRSWRRGGGERWYGEP